MEFRKWLNWKLNWPVYVLLLSFLPAFAWWGIWSGGMLLRWWRAAEGCVPESVFFRMEEFIALNSHQNEWPGRCGMYLILAACVIFLLLRVFRVIRTSVWALLILLAFAWLNLFFSDCMCRSMEHRLRNQCRHSLETFRRAFAVWGKEHGAYPPGLDSEDFPPQKFWKELKACSCCRHLYYGAGKKPGDARFVILEDAPRSHAGNLRHRLWSDGTIDSVHPWD